MRTRGWTGRRASGWIWNGVRWGALLTMAAPGLGAGWSGPAGAFLRAGASGAECRKVLLTGEVKGGQEWRASIGQGWVFRVLPIAAGKGTDYSGWDLVVDRAAGGGYPDAVLLGTPPYGSVSEREIGTTFGMRAQDAIGWNPRRFHFLTSDRELERGRTAFAEMMQAAPGDRAGQAKATAVLMEALKGAGSGEFRVLDARLSAGGGDAPEFARQWSERLGETPHTVDAKGGVSAARGELKWMRFSTTLWLPGDWVTPKGMRFEVAKCPQ